MEEEQKKATEFLLIKNGYREGAELAVVRKAKRDTKEGRLTERTERVTATSSQRIGEVQH